MSVLIWHFLHWLITICKRFLWSGRSTSQELCLTVFFHQLFSKPGPRRHFRLVASPPRPSNTLCCLLHGGPQGVLEATCDFKEKISKRQKHVLAAFGTFLLSLSFLTDFWADSHSSCCMHLLLFELLASPSPAHGKCAQKRSPGGTSLVVQWLRICLLMQGTRVRSLVWELRSHVPWDT